MATVSKWTPFGVALDITATGGTVTRTSATQFTVNITASWETYYTGAKTKYGMSATAGGITKTISAFDGTSRSNGSASFTGTFTISGNGSATKSITVTFKNFDTDNNKSATKTVSFNVTVPAWPSYTITYNGNGTNVSGVPSSQTKWKNQSLTLSSTKPTRTGYSFLGWSTSSTATSATYTAGASYTTNAAATLYAVWKANTYKITYNANGSGVSNVPSAQTKTYGKTLTLSTGKPTRSNYNFKGWATSESGSVVYNPGDNYSTNAAANLYAVWELAYTEPRITNLTLTRCDANGNPTDSGTYARVLFNWAADYELSNSSLLIQWKFANSDDYIYTDDWFKEVSVKSGSSSGSVNEVVGNGTIDTDSTYTFCITVGDTGGRTQKTGNLSSSIYHIDCIAPTDTGEVGGVAIGKAAELDGFFDVGWAAKFAKNAYVGETKAWDDGLAGTKLSPSGGIVIQRVSGTSPYVDFRFYGTAGEYDGRIVLDKDTKSFEFKGADDFYISSAKAGNASFRPYYRKGDTISSQTVNTAGYVTNSGKDVYFVIPLAKPVIGKPTVTIATTSTLVLRQNNSYTHGTTNEAPGVAAYTATLAENHIRVKASFTNVTNVTNNDSIGIVWTGNVTFS